VVRHNDVQHGVGKQLRKVVNGVDCFAYARVGKWDFTLQQADVRHLNRETSTVVQIHLADVV
jgi:hypothetical protein